MRSLQVATVRSWLPLRFTKIPIYGKIKNVPNHQPGYHPISSTFFQIQICDKWLATYPNYLPSFTTHSPNPTSQNQPRNQEPSRNHLRIIYQPISVANFRYSAKDKQQWASLAIYPVCLTKSQCFAAKKTSSIPIFMIESSCFVGDFITIKNRDFVLLPTRSIHDPWLLGLQIMHQPALLQPLSFIAMEEMLQCSHHHSLSGERDRGICVSGLRLKMIT